MDADPFATFLQHALGQHWSHFWRYLLDSLSIRRHSINTGTGASGDGSWGRRAQADDNNSTMVPGKFGRAPLHASKKRRFKAMINPLEHDTRMAVILVLSALAPAVSRGIIS
jgi:hypothetical protein